MLKKDLIRLIGDLIQREGGIYIPYIVDTSGLSLEKVCQIVIDEWPAGHMKDNLYVPKLDTPRWYYEVCDTPYNRGKVVHRNIIKEYCENNETVDQHHSVFLHDQEWVDNIVKKDTIKTYSTVRCDSIWLELDRKSDGGLDKAIVDASIIYDRFPYKDHICVWVSGNQSTHIEIDGALFGNPRGSKSKLCGRGNYIYNLAHFIAGDVRHKNGLVDPWLEDEEKVRQAYINLTGRQPKEGYKQELENIDPNIYGFNSLIRAKWSIHEKGKGQKVPIFGTPEFPTTKPVLLSWYVQNCYQKRRDRPVVEVDVESSYIVQEFLDIPGFDPNDCNPWSSHLYNPFDPEDTKPGLTVNIENGLFWDFGNPDYQFGFVEYLMTKYNITYEEALEKIKENE